MFLFKTAVPVLPSIQAAQKLAEDSSIVLLDVRTREEYREARLPNSKNLPLNQIDNITSQVADKNSKIYVYCHSGARSQQACEKLMKIGYRNVTNIGGIIQWKGKIERG
ncbi:rhodanese-like domain-containing protein [Scatolibacter rhodanostii]|uniref:rhodanese-like domain-containing protein n=1 Tax=Scatolibacter rhodanostii TaxID=2014781 RepID=UPI000C0747EE|nr:rhodanese-like domain-containing protein [Scatolibacter rhodanostii]